MLGIATQQYSISSLLLDHDLRSNPKVLTAQISFFRDQERCSIQPLQAMDPDHGIAQVHSCVPDLRRVAVVPDAQPSLAEVIEPSRMAP